MRRVAVRRRRSGGGRSRATPAGDASLGIPPRKRLATGSMVQRLAGALACGAAGDSARSSDAQCSAQLESPAPGSGWGPDAGVAGAAP